MLLSASYCILALVVHCKLHSVIHDNLMRQYSIFKRMIIRGLVGFIALFNWFTFGSVSCLALF